MVRVEVGHPAFPLMRKGAHEWGTRRGTGVSEVPPVTLKAHQRIYGLTNHSEVVRRELADCVL